MYMYVPGPTRLLRADLETRSPACEAGAIGDNKRAKKLQPASLEIRGLRFTCTAPTRWPPLHAYIYIYTLTDHFIR